MKLRILVSILCISNISIVNAAAPGKKLTEEAFLDQHKPDKNRCRPGVIAGKDGEPESNPQFLGGSIEGTIACMLKGEKNVYMVNKESDFERLFSDLKDLKELMAAKNYEHFKLLDGTNIVFSPAGRRYAFLFGKLKLAGPGAVNGGYLTGFLLGYSDDDIEAFFKRISASEEQYRKAKREDVKWLRENIHGIDEWAIKNLKIENFQKSQADSQTASATASSANTLGQATAAASSADVKASTVEKTDVKK